VPIEPNSVSLRDDSVRGRIRILYIDGNSMPEIMEKIGMSINTWDSAFYRNTHGIRDFYLEIKKEKMIMDAEKVSKRIMGMKLGKKNAKLLSIQQKEAEFIRETQGKDLGYSKRIETIGLNINKNEPLDDEQKKRLDNLLKKAGQQTTQNADVVNSPIDKPETV
jgi:hypothetical protein